LNDTTTSRTKVNHVYLIIHVKTLYDTTSSLYSKISILKRSHDFLLCTKKDTHCVLFIR